MAKNDDNNNAAGSTICHIPSVVQMSLNKTKNLPYEISKIQNL